MFRVVSVNLEQDYPDLEKWWKDWGWPPFPKEFLPQGVMVKYGDDKVCAVFLYETNTPICWVENYISNKVLPKEVRDEGLNLLIETALEIAKDKGFKVVMSAVKHNNLSKRLMSKGFIESDTGLTNYIRVL